MRSTDIAPVLEFLRCPTPDAWVEAALTRQELLLIDHANCEKKAASTALNLMFRYSGDVELLGGLSRLAREELRHFEQVLKLMRERGIAYRRIDAARYAQGLRELVRTHEPARLVDTLIAGAFMTMGVLLPGALLDRGFEAHVGGIALGIGLGWLIKSTIDHVKGESYES